MNEALQTQIGGSHYKDMQVQPVEFIVKADLTFIQGCIVKYITRYKSKNGKQDIEKAKHFAQLAIDLCDAGPEVPSIGLAYHYCQANKLSTIQQNTIVATVKEDYYNVIRYCNQIIKQEYS